MCVCVLDFTASSRVVLLSSLFPFSTHFCPSFCFAFTPLFFLIFSRRVGTADGGIGPVGRGPHRVRRRGRLVLWVGQHDCPFLLPSSLSFLLRLLHFRFRGEFTIHLFL